MTNEISKMVNNVDKTKFLDNKDELGIYRCDNNNNIGTVCRVSKK